MITSHSSHLIGQLVVGPFDVGLSAGVKINFSKKIQFDAGEKKISLFFELF